MFLGRAPGSFLGDFSAKTAPNRERADNGVSLQSIPGGDQGTAATLRVMRDMARASIRNPNQVIRKKVMELLGSLPPRQWMAEVYALHAFVRDQIRYLKDPVDLELVQSPEMTLQNGQGDCDDKATLLAALLSTAGHPSRFVAIGFDDHFSHVLVETQVGQRWMPLETIIQQPAGWFPPGVKRAYRLKV